MKSKDGRLLARANELSVLRALHRFGWLRTRDIAALIWTKWNKSPVTNPSLAPIVASASALRMAQRTLRRMREGRLLLQAHGPDGSTVYALAEAGVRALLSLDVKATSGKDAARNLSSGYFRHRCIANEIAIAGIVRGFRVSTERETARGLWPGGANGIAGKKPDCLWRDPTAGPGAQVWTWHEVERSRRNARDHAALLAWLMRLRACVQPSIGAVIGGGVVIRRVVFICTAPFRARILRELAELTWPADEVQKLVFFELSLYKLKDINFRM